jgi:DNA-binding NarL/FixJ family response regulator
MATARLLIVDDEPEILSFVSRVLKNRYEVISASSPRNALEIVRTKSAIDLVLSDVEMPEMRGPDLLNEVNRISPSTMGLLMSGNEEYATLLPAGIPFLKKPFSSIELHASIESTLAASRKLHADLQKESEKTTALSEQTQRLSYELSEDRCNSTVNCEKSKENRNLPPKTHSAPSAYPGPAHKIRILLVDDHPIVRNMIANLLGDEPDMQVIGEAADGQNAVELAARLLPDVILMDMSLSKLNGVEATRIIHNDWPHIRIIGLSMFEDADTAQAMRDAGAADYLTKSGPVESLIDVIRKSIGASNKGFSRQALRLIGTSQEQAERAIKGRIKICSVN